MNLNHEDRIRDFQFPDSSLRTNINILFSSEIIFCDSLGLLMLNRARSLKGGGANYTGHHNRKVAGCPTLGAGNCDLGR